MPASDKSASTLLFGLEIRVRLQAGHDQQVPGHQPAQDRTPPIQAGRLGFPSQDVGSQRMGLSKVKVLADKVKNGLIPKEAGGMPMDCER